MKKQKVNIKRITEFIKHVPKAELHLHIEGTLEPELMFKLAKKNNVSIPYKNVKEVKSAYNFKNLDSFLDIYYQSSKVLINEEYPFELIKYSNENFKKDFIYKSKNGSFKIFIPEWLKI